MDKKRAQQIWDRLLLSNWCEKGWNKMFHVVNSFLFEVDPDLYKNGSLLEKEDFLIELDLKRCLDVDKRYDVKTFKAWKTDVIGFIHARCEKMSLDLIDGKNPIEVLLDIESYKWKRIDSNASARYRNKQNYQKKKAKTEITIKAREIKDKHDWRTIK